jgi:Tfp pilus assembly protein PilF
LLLVAISVVMVRLRKSRPYLLVGWLWFLGTLVPVIGLLQVGGQSIADRYTYIPSIGFFIALSWGATELCRVFHCRPVVAWALAGAVVAGCWLQAARQLRYWANTETLFRHVCEVTPANCVAHSVLASYYLNCGQLDKARAECAEAIRLDPSYVSSYDFLAMVALRESKLDEAAENIRTAIRLNPKRASYYLVFGQILFLGGLPDQAAAQFKNALGLDPGSPAAHCWLGKCLVSQGKLSEARAELEEATRQDPAYAEAYYQMGVVYSMQGKTSDAVSRYRAALKLSPDEIRTLNNLAWTLASDPNPEIRIGTEAVRLAEHACEITSNSEPMCLSTLAASYAEAGRFDDAVATAQRAHDLAMKQAQGAKNPDEVKSSENLAARNLEWMEIYRAHRPYHQQ